MQRNATQLDMNISVCAVSAVSPVSEWKLLQLISLFCTSVYFTMHDGCFKNCHHIVLAILQVPTLLCECVCVFLWGGKVLTPTSPHDRKFLDNWKFCAIRSLVELQRVFACISASNISH